MFRTGRSPHSTRPPASAPEDAPSSEDAQGIRCSYCSTVITHHHEALRIDNRHEHAFFNPAGIAFELRCFRTAQGVVPSGPSTAEFTWFPGYSWQVVLCAACHIHLGWLYTGATSFFGLIATRLI